MTTITVDRAVLEQALEALELYRKETNSKMQRKAITALRAALAHPTVDPTDPGHDVDVLREQVRHLERRVRELHALAQEEPDLRNANPIGLTPPQKALQREQFRADALAQEEQEPEQANYYEEKLQVVAEYISDKYHVWYGVATRDIEEVLRQSVRCGLVSNPPRREWQSLTADAVFANDKIMAVNASLGLKMNQLMDLVCAVEARLRELNHG